MVALAMGENLPAQFAFDVGAHHAHPPDRGRS